MKTRIYTISLLTLALLVSCQNREEAPAIDKTFKLIAVQDNGADSKTVISGERSVYWEPTEEIKVFRADGTGYLFKSANTEPAASAVFSGELTVDDVEAGEELWAVYPFSDGATFDGEAITTVLPSDQVARPESFARNMNLSVARTTGNKLQFYNVGGGVRFSVTQEGIGKVIFEGLNGEILSGKVTIGFEEGVPVVKEVSGGSMFITLTPPDGETFQTGKWYYMVAIPGALEQGYKLRFYKGEDYAKRVSETPVTIKRGVFGSVADADKENEYEPTTTVFPETKEEWKKSNELTNTIGKKVSSIINELMTENESVDTKQLVNLVSSIEGIDDVSSIGDNEGIVMRLSNGVYVNAIYDFILNQEDNNSESYSRVRRSVDVSPSLVIPNTGKKKAVLINPFQNRNIGIKTPVTIDVNKIYNTLVDVGYSLEYYPDDYATLQVLNPSYLSKFDLILYATHGNYKYKIRNQKGDVYETILMTAQKVGTLDDVGMEDLAALLCDDGVYYSITPRWLESYEDKYSFCAAFNRTIVFSLACNSLVNNDFAEFFTKRGASIYVGDKHMINGDDVIIAADGIVEYLSMGVSVRNAINLIKSDFSFLGRVYYPLVASDEPFGTAYLIDPTPINLKQTIKNTTVTLIWDQPKTKGTFNYRVYLNGNVYTPDTSRGVTLELQPGDYSWYVEADLIIDGDVIETFKSNESSFSVKNTASDKLIKSMSLKTDYPGAYFKQASLSFGYDSQSRLTSVGGDASYTFTYSGDKMTYSDNGTAQLNSLGQFSSITWYRTTVTFKYDSEGRLSSLNDSGMKINYKWSGNDLYSVAYSDGSTEMKPHFEPSTYLAPEKGVDINLMMRIFLNEIGFEGVLPDGNFFPMMASLIGKRSEHVLGLQVSQTATFDRVGNEGFSQYKGNDGKWHSLDYDTLYNWTEGTGEFEVKGSNVPYKLESKSWNWTADSSGAVTKGVWPLVQYVASSVTGTMVVRRSSEDINYDGVVDGRDITVSFKNGQVNGSTSKKNYSITFTFGY